MPNLLTTAEFINKANNAHNHKYDYSQINYTGMKSRLIVSCPIHGSFVQSADAHLHKKQGCAKCTHISNGNNRKMTFETFLEKAKIKYNNKYTYDPDSFIDGSSLVKITCPIHGEFKIKATRHINKYAQECHSCTKINKPRLTPYSKGHRIFKESKKFFEKAAVYHKNKFIYDKSSYINYGTNIKIFCSIHGWFEQTPGNHISGITGCKFCGKKSFTRTSFKEFCRGRTSSAYLLKFSNENEIFYKIGISVNLRARLVQLRKYYNVELINQIDFQDGAITYDKEIDLHRKCREFKYKPNINFEGYTECFQYRKEVLDIFLEG